MILTNMAKYVESVVSMPRVRRCRRITYDIILLCCFILIYQLP